MPVTPYLFFDGRCEEALAFYEKALGAKVGMMMRFKDAPESPPSEGCADTDNAKLADKIMHAAFVISGTTVMASDGLRAARRSSPGFRFRSTPRPRPRSITSSRRSATAAKSGCSPRRRSSPSGSEKSSTVSASTGW